MSNTQYDNDATTWSPQGRLLQVEYACEAIKQGSVSVGLRNKEHCVLVAIKRSPEEFAGYQKKIIPIDTHVGVAIAGLTSDARVLSAFMRSASLKERDTFNRPISMHQLAVLVADKAQHNTQFYGGRPYGVGLLLAGSDATGVHLFECLPTGTFLEYHGMALGARSQSARTYLEKTLDTFKAGSDLESLILHGLAALQETLPQDVAGLTADTLAIAHVSKTTGVFSVLEDASIVADYVRQLGVFAPRKTTRATNDATTSVSSSSITPSMGAMEVEETL